MSLHFRTEKSMKLYLFLTFYSIKAVLCKESCNEFTSDEDLRVNAWTTPVFVKNLENSETLQGFVAYPKISESKKNLKKIIRERKEYKFMFPLIEHDNRIGENHFLRHVQKNDMEYYNEPNYVPQLSHSNEHRLQKYLKGILRPKSTVLDLATGWESHLPSDLKFKTVFGIGLSKAELENNDQLNAYFIQDLNLTPKLLKFKNESVDTVLLSFSIQLMIKPFELFLEVKRILKPQGNFIVTFGDYDEEHFDKVIQAWYFTIHAMHVHMVTYYFEVTGPWTKLEIEELPTKHSKVFVMNGIK